ncbi:MAG: tetratricopeptide repeat protein [Bryobacteraceae bacterium]
MRALRSVLRLVLQMAFCIVAVTPALAQSDDIFERVRRVLAVSGEGELASAALAKKNFAQVEDMLARSKASTEPERAELLSLQGAIRFLDGKMSAAVEAFTKAAEMAPLNDNDRFTFAMAFVNLGHDTRARALLSGLAEKHPERAIYLYWLGRLDYDQRRYKEAVEKLREAAQLDPKSARVWDSLGLAFDMQGQLEQALGALEKAASLNREQAHSSPWPPHDLGYLLLRMDKSKDAEAALRESLQYNPKLTQAHYHLARALEKEGKETEAIGEYVTAVSGDTAASDACYSLGMLYRKLHRDEEANAMFAEYKRRKQIIANSELTRSEIRQ